MREWRDASRIDPRLLLARQHLAGTLFNHREFDAAIREWREAIRFHSKNATLHNDLAAALAGKGDLEAAVREFEQAIRMDPKLALACNNLAQLLASVSQPNLRDPCRAVRLAEQAVRLSPNEGNYWHTLGVAHYRAGDPKAALGALEKAMQLRAPGDAAGWLVRAMAHGQLGQKDQARQWYDKANQWIEQKQPKDDALHRLRSEAEQVLGIQREPKQGTEDR
jgi:Flp pilus assembly protein TadD